MRDTIRVSRAELLDQMLAQRGIATSFDVIRPGRQGTEPLPLSSAQQRLWFAEQLQPGAHVYNMPLGTRLSGTLDIPALRGSLDEMVRRHAVLRTSFPASHGVPY